MALLKKQKSSIYGLENDLTTLSTDISNETSRATSAEATITSNLNAEITRATGAEATITSNLNAEITRATGAEAAIQSELDATQTGAGLGTDGSYSANAGANYIAGATSLVSADNLLDAAIKTEETARIAADATLQSNIDAEASARIAADATLQSNIDTVSATVAALGNAFNYVGGVNGGADSANAFDLTTLPAGGTDAGDYYKVIVAGYFKVGAEGTPFYANVGDGIVFNINGGVDKIDNTDSNVSGTVNEIVVDGSADTGFIVSIDPIFSGRVSTVESGLASEITRATGAEATITSNLNAEITRATGAEAALDAAKMAKSANLSDVADVAVARTNLDVYSKSEVDTAIAGQSNKTMNASATIANDKITFAKAPVDGVNGIAFSSVRVFGVVVSNPEVYDECQISGIDATDATGKTFILSPDVAGMYDGKTAQAFISYNPAI